jgi:aspartate/methionine/tyrosine aminotransferase
VFITPGFIFGSNGERYIRISLGVSTERMQEAYRRIADYVNNKEQQKNK